MNKVRLPLVSIIAVCHNHETFLIETLDSIIDQTYPNIEIIIIDNQCTDNSNQIIKNWLTENSVQAKFIENDASYGICKNFNLGLFHANGKYFQGISCDDIMLPEKIARQVAILERADDNVAMVYSDAFNIDESSNVLYGWHIQRLYPERLFALPKGDILENLIKKNFIPAMSVLIKTDLVRELGCYDEELCFEDYEMWFRILTKFKIIPDEDYPSVQYRTHQSNFQRKFRTQIYVDILKICEKYYDYSPNFKKKMEKTLLFIYTKDKKVARENARRYKSFISKKVFSVIISQVPSRLVKLITARGSFII